MRIIQLMGVLYKLYENNNISIDNDIFVSTLFYQINLVKNFSFLESSFKNNLIPKNNKLGWYLIDKATHSKNEIYDWEKVFDIAIENLMEKEEGFGQAVDELMENENYYDCFELIIDYLKNDSEICFFRKESLDCFNIYCYPIKITEESGFFTNKKIINFLSYPLGISVNFFHA